jgi:hypothetical protein
VGACSGLGSLLWNIYTKLVSGPRLEVTALTNMVMMPPPPNNPRFLQIKVHNAGSAPTTINTVCFHAYRSWWARFKDRPSAPAVVLYTYQGPQLPQKLEIGAEWIAAMEQDKHFDEWLRSDMLWTVVYHSFSTKPAKARIIPGPLV